MTVLTQDKLRRIGLIGDIHCEDQLLESSLRFLQEAGVDVICAVGDIVDGPGNANRAIELLVQHHVLTVRGNHERWLFAGEMRGLADANSRFDLNADSWEFLPDLPVLRRLETVQGRALLCHGLGEDDMAGVWPDESPAQILENTTLWRLAHSHDYEFILNGHTHYRMVRSFDAMTVINAGTLYRKHEPGFCIVDFEAGVVQFYNVGFGDRVVEAERHLLPVFSTPAGSRGEDRPPMTPAFDERTLLIATTNKGKVAELADMLQGMEYRVIGLSSLPDPPPPVEETGTTFEENALLKARYYHEQTGLLTLADDSGLEVDALDGRPGVYSARYGGDDLSEEEQVQLLLRELNDVPEARRTGRYVCCIALAGPRLEQAFTESCEGRIAFAPIGTGGFGYDPVFYDPELGCTFAEISREAKAARSHRGKALRAARQFLETAAPSI